ncbi:MAG: glycosyltransferase [Candidatus Neomarinimicrobiota bacterium]
MKINAPKLKAHFDYRKFRSPPYRLLFLNYDYFLQDYLINELKRQGHQVILLPFPQNIPVEEALRTILTKAAEVRPDAILTLNALGLDNHGHTLSVLSELSLPVIIWYLDNHLFKGPYLQDRSAQWTIVFTYERALEPTLTEAGFQHVFYLPLASDPNLPGSGKDSRFKSLRNKITFIGGTFSSAIESHYEPEFEQAYQEWQPDFGAQKQRHGRIHLNALFAPHRNRFSSPEVFFRFMAYVIAKETFRYRAERLAYLKDTPLTVFGPAEWKDHLPDAMVQPPVDYQTVTPLIYRNSAVNLSLTTLQQETALNQRYFDVPLCGGFLLGEWQESLAEHFDVDKEVVYFRNDEELKEKARYYLNHPAERQRILDKARQRVLNEHLMQHRVTTMLDHIRQVCD